MNPLMMQGGEERSGGVEMVPPSAAAGRRHDGDRSGLAESQEAPSSDEPELDLCDLFSPAAAAASAPEQQHHQQQQAAPAAAGAMFSDSGLTTASRDDPVSQRSNPMMATRPGGWSKSNSRMVKARAAVADDSKPSAGGGLL